MKAMILAAGKGTRLAPLTNNTPKALVSFQGEPILEIILKRLRFAGFTDVVINVHHFADQIEDYISKRTDDGMSIVLSYEEELLDTGGGIKKAASLLGNEPVLFHNVDVITELDLRKFYQTHVESDYQITLAVKDRPSSRHLLFTPDQLLSGWNYPDRNLTIITRESKKGYLETAFSAIYIMDPAVFNNFPEESIFSLTPWLIEMSKKQDIKAYDHSEDLWFDLGSFDHFTHVQQKITLSKDGSPGIGMNK